MKFFPKTLLLYADNHKLLKELNCPLKKNWSALVIDKETPLKRYCNSCGNDVIDITEFTEQQVVDLLKIDAESCLCIREDSQYIEWADEPSRHRFPMTQICTVDSDERIDGCRIVKTARNGAQIESNQDNYYVIEKAVEINEQIKEKVVLQYDRKGFSGYDYRGMPLGMTNWWHPLKSKLPFAAYLVPKDIEVGEKVFVPDIIEEFIGSRWNQGDVFRLNEGFGIFTGDDIEFEYPTDPDDVGEFLG